MTMMHNRMGAGVGSGAKRLAYGRFSPTSNWGINYFGPTKTRQFVETNIGACGAVSSVTGFTTKRRNKSLVQCTNWELGLATITDRC